MVEVAKMKIFRLEVFMTLGARLMAARKKCGYTQRELARQIGAKHNSISNWEKDRNMPDPLTIEAICRVLSVTPNQLLWGQTEVGGVFFDDLASSERNLLRIYRSLDEKARGAVDALLSYFASLSVQDAPAQSPVSLPPTSPSFSVITGRLSVQSVAAGTGTDLDEDLFETIQLLENAVTRSAQFYVPVEGNSMEPRYHDGDILAVGGGAVQRGEIGIFTLGGYGYLKKLGDGALLSLNPQYAPIPLDEDVICNGKVIGVVDPSWIVE